MELGGVSRSGTATRDVFGSSPAPGLRCSAALVELRGPKMIAVRIPWVGQEVAGDSDKLHTVFRVEVVTNGRKHLVDRRHRDFQALHKKLKKTMKPPDFPLKRGLNRGPKALEQRRSGLEVYLQTLCNNQLISQEIRDFLNIKHVPSGKPPRCLSALQESELRSNRFCRQVVTFTKDSFGLSADTDTLPNMVVVGVLQGLYVTESLSELWPNPSPADNDSLHAEPCLRLAPASTADY
ncbi:sorting nexin-24-like isoform X1 [Hypanus sabinus]|uniref:sorting nexin-24-like isoform X1 n=1 Tax=Hypanus sabinus TaxID=79690 RepID=UPI0028C44B7B|nr:sorting nexin-24-like isoform X1 [Hypanus sabinus]